MGRGLQGVEDWGLWVRPGLESGSLNSRPWARTAVQLEGPCCLPCPWLHYGRGPREGGWHVSPCLPESSLDLPSCLATPQETDPLKVYPKLKGSFLENLKHLKNTMGPLEWKVSSHPLRWLPLIPDI